jgi:hypothetical protein
MHSHQPDGIDRDLVDFDVLVGLTRGGQRYMLRRGSRHLRPASNEVMRREMRVLSAIAWYTVLACFKLGIVLEGTHARAAGGKAPIATGDLLHAVTLGLFARARSVIAGGEPWPSTSP